MYCLGQSQSEQVSALLEQLGALAFTRLRALCLFGRRKIGSSNIFMLQHLGGVGYKSEGSKKRYSKKYFYLLHIAVSSQKSEKNTDCKGGKKPSIKQKKYNW